MWRRNLRVISYNVSAVVTPMSWTRKAFLPGGACTQQIGVVPARATAVNGIRADVFPQGTLASTALLCEVARLLARRPTRRRPLNENVRLTPAIFLLQISEQQSLYQCFLKSQYNVLHNKKRRFSKTVWLVYYLVIVQPSIYLETYLTVS